MMVVLALAVLVWARVSGLPWEDLGLTRPSSWTLTILGGLALGVALKLLMKVVVLPLIGAPAINAAFGDLVGNAARLPAIIVTVIVSGGIAEEIFFRGFLFDRSAKAFGTGAPQLIATVVATSILFAIAHFIDQGVPGVQQAIGTGLVFGALFALTGVIWPVMIAHAAYDLAAVVIIYFGLEEQIAHLVFR